MQPIYLTEAEVESLLNMRMTIDAVEEGFRQLGQTAVNVPRERAKTAGLVLHSMSAAAPHVGRAGWKCYTTTRAGAKFHVGLYDIDSGDLLALIEANRLGQFRTGAATGVAVSWLARPEAGELGLFGTGWQAQTQLMAAATVRPIKQAFVYSRDEERRQTFARQMSEQLGLEVVPVDRPQEAAADLPIVITATSSKSPVFDGMDLAEGTLVCAVGSNWLNKAEIDVNTVRRADNVVCDSVEACRREAGDFTAALEAGVFDWSRPVDLADVVLGRAIGRSNPQSVVIFKSVGLALEDVVLATQIEAAARAQGIGRPLRG